jgi:hypothetical protein
MTPTVRPSPTTTPVLSTLLKVVSPYPHPVTLPPTFDGEGFYDIASRHYLCALVNARLGSAAKQLPGEIQAQFSRDQHISAANTMFYEAGLEEVTELFYTAGIPLVAYKGIPLARTLYGDAALRPTGDIDVMVRPDDLGRTRQLLEAHGWEFQRAWEIHHNFAKEIWGKEVILEVHWVSQREGEYHLPPERFWEEIHPTATGWEFSPEMNLLIITLHCARHSFTPYRQVVDIAHAVAQWGNTLNWQRLMDLAMEADALHIVAIVMAVVHRDLGVPLPDHPLLTRLMQSRRVRLALRYLSPRRLLDKPMFSALDRYIVPAITGAWGPARLVLHDLLPPPELIQYRYGIPANSPWVPLYVLGRPFELLIKNIRKQFRNSNS